MTAKTIDPVVLALDSVSYSFFNETAMADFEARLLAETFLAVYSKETQNFEQYKDLENKGCFPYGFTAVNLLVADLRRETYESITLSGVVCQGEGRLNTLRLNLNDGLITQKKVAEWQYPHKSIS